MKEKETKFKQTKTKPNETEDIVISTQKQNLFNIQKIERMTSSQGEKININCHNKERKEQQEKCLKQLDFSNEKKMIEFDTIMEPKRKIPFVDYNTYWCCSREVNEHKNRVYNWLGSFIFDDFINSNKMKLSQLDVECWNTFDLYFRSIEKVDFCWDKKSVLIIPTLIRNNHWVAFIFLKRDLTWSLFYFDTLPQNNKNNTTIPTDIDPRYFKLFGDLFGNYSIEKTTVMIQTNGWECGYRIVFFIHKLLLGCSLYDSVKYNKEEFMNFVEEFKKMYPNNDFMFVSLHQPTLFVFILPITIRRWVGFKTQSDLVVLMLFYVCLDCFRVN
ncbi:hypothetical protein EIN_176960 [Entamoeba invadens IP1]|uniref:hypothetical protein n=1 Tax=Entamoeba invadens IP1 TaxID=370355 RepID=UPI0002C3CE40|nr:hypothetical protein EIN_176960 [Entamoeba invadens IP1]ELP93869.1 hypothetical protein EIN_176960 [Entamoeba invadens IP1]|eukprot:XP_004260640.1 hypothetical protein EIN_176960 [Entamoeba invadens IP1]